MRSDRLCWKILKILAHTKYSFGRCFEAVFFFISIAFSFSSLAPGFKRSVHFRTYWLHFALCVRLLLIFVFIPSACCSHNKIISIAFCVIFLLFFTLLPFSLFFLCSLQLSVRCCFSSSFWHKSVHFLEIANYMWEIVRFGTSTTSLTWKMWCKTLWKINSLVC